MKDRLKKLFKIEINTKILAVIMTLALLVVVAPIIRIMMYSVPWYDDFGYGKSVKNIVENGGSVLDALRGAADNAKSMYYAWQGTFSSCFMMSLMPAAWGTDKYVLGLWFILAVFMLGIYSLVHVLLRNVVRADRWSTFTVGVIVTATCVLLFRSPIEGLFWYNAGVHYTAMHGFGMILTAMLIKAIYTEKKVLRGILVCLSVPLAFFIGGANYVTILQMALVILSILGWGLLFKKKSVLWAIPSGVAMGIAMGISIAAPGNAHRMVHFTDMTTTPMEAVLNSFKSAFTYFDDFTGFRTFIILIMMTPLVIQIVTKTSFEFRYPWLVLLWSFCLYATGFTPTLYTMGHTLLSRATNMAQVTFQILLFLNWFYLIGWSCRFVRRKKGREVSCGNSLCFYMLIFLAMLGIYAAEPNKGGKYTTYVSYYFVHTGEAYNYHQEYLQRVEACESEEADVVVKPYAFKPWVLCLGDLSSDPAYEPNAMMASYFGKNSIVCEGVSE